ncbi:MAG TPA: hypothetical protein VKV20_08000 [Ktedonobacteraceae bacterium]|nr:hypothetical protein [Ktedonobacteraceae bacterium]
MQQHFATLSHLAQELQQLDMRRQAAIQVGGDPATLNQYEQQIRASDLAVPSNLAAAHELQNRLRQQLGNMQEQQTLKATAQMARDNQVRLAEKLEQARSSANERGETDHRTSGCSQATSLCGEATRKSVGGGIAASGFSLEY